MTDRSRLDLYVHQAPDARLEALVAQLEGLITRMEKAMSQLDDDIAALTAEVAHLTSVDASAEALIAGIPQLITDAVNKALAAGATPQQLQALTDLTTAIKDQDDKLAAAVTANTPAA